MKKKSIIIICAVALVALIVVVLGKDMWFGGFHFGPPEVGRMPPEASWVKVDATINEDSYSPGEDIVIELTFQNNSTDMFLMEPFPPKIMVMPSLKYGLVIREFPEGAEAKSLEPGETASYTLTWDQRDKNGQQVPVGDYKLALGNIDAWNQRFILTLDKPVEITIAPASELAPTPPPSPESGKKIDANHVHVKNGEVIVFSGTSTLPDGTHLQTQLYVRDDPLSWWPTEKFIQVQDGNWGISVPLGENAAPKYLSMSTYYSFKIWEKDNPAVVAGYGFDLMGPPPTHEIFPDASQFPEELREQLHAGNPVVMMRILYTMRGESSYFGIYEDGFVYFVEETGLRPTMQTTEIWKAGRISKEELDSLADFMRGSRFMEMEDHYSLSTIPCTDLDLRIQVYYQDINKFVTAQGYFSPDDGKTIPDMPYPLNEIYKRLKDIADNKTDEVTREFRGMGRG